MGLEIINVPGATGGADTDIKCKLDFALKTLETRDFCLINIKATDNFSHDGNFKGKTEMIEKIDAKLGGIVRETNKNLVVAILGDHTTPCSLKAHSGDPVPLVIKGPTTRVDLSRGFDEKNCMQGGVGRIRGTDLLLILMNLAGKEKLYGA
jgi:2,3-bisphosphoglycerate-independent phosphoglycerate mutase